MTKDGYYTSGEFAKKANVTLRTIRYYDRQGILKPSKVADNGYRLYTDADFAKLQKILSLKYLGFSLEEIMTMTINDEDQDQRINQLAVISCTKEDGTFETGRTILRRDGTKDGK